MLRLALTAALTATLAVACSTPSLAQCMVEEEIVMFRFAGITGKSLTKAGTIKVKGGPAGIRTAE